MYRDSAVGVVVPAYNEAAFVGDVIASMPAFVDCVYAVDDCSSDGTWTAIREHATATRTATPGQPAVDAQPDGGEIERDVDTADTEPRGDGDDRDTTGTRVVGIRHRQNAGVGGAITTGYRRALADGMDVVAVINGDGQMDPAILDRFVEPVIAGEADYVKGNRLATPADRREMSGWRLFGNAVLTFLTKVASGYWKMTDPQNGYTAISRRALETLDLDSLYRDYGFCNDVLVRLNAHECRVADVRMEAVYGDEQSGISYSSFVPKLSLLLLSGFLWRLKTRYLVSDFHPLVLLYALGAVGTLSGVVYAVGATVAGASLALVAPLALLLGLSGGLLIVLAMTFDMLYNEHLETSARSRPSNS